MDTTTRCRAGDTARSFIGRYLPPTLAAGSGSILLAGCAVVVATAVGAAAAVLTGLFLGSIQATFAATARSYAFTDTGPVQLMFSPPEAARVSLVRFQGRLPGFHLAIITDAGKDLPRSQPDEIVFETSVNIDFEASPPTLTGTIQERGGEPVDLRVLYPAIVSVTQELSEPDDGDRRQLTVTIVAQAADGAQVEYTLTLQTRLVAEGGALDGDVAVERIYTPEDGEPLVVVADGSFEVAKPGGTPDDAGLEDDNANEADNANEDDNANDNEGDDEEPDVENDNLDDEPANDNVDDEPVDDGVEPAEPTPASACIPGLSELAAGAVDLFVESGGKAGLDGDGDGTVTAAEVSAAINPVLVPFLLEVSPGAAGCIAELANSE